MTVLAKYHLSIGPVQRANDRSSVGAAAYRHGIELKDERTDISHDYRLKLGVMETEIFIPRGVQVPWSLEPGPVWNAAEVAETKANARPAFDFEASLPCELNEGERRTLAREWAQALAERYGTVADMAIHAPTGETDERNHHVHILVGSRTVGPDGFGAKTMLGMSDTKRRAAGLPTGSEEFKLVREAWADMANAHLAMAGHDVRIDHRSHEDRGLALLPTEHMGPHATQKLREGTPIDRARVNADRRVYNAQLIADDPGQVLRLITDERSVFDRHDIARCVSRYIDDPEQFQTVLSKVLASPELEVLEPAMGSREARLSTRDMIEVEAGVAHAVDRMAAVSDGRLRTSPHRVSDRKVQGALDDRSGSRGYDLSPEQVTAVRHVTGPQQATCVVGLAGAGKSTMLATARVAWEADGHRVLGATLAGKAAEELQAASGIESRTLASYQYAWKQDPDRTGPSALRQGDVLVIDEAGMVGSRQMAEFVTEVEHVGAKIVLVGDPEQLQPINAGAAFRSIVERIGCASMDDVRRQHVPWQREASVALAGHRTADALRGYIEHGNIGFSDTRADARERVVADVVRDRADRPDGTRMVLTHRRADVRELNLDIRTHLLRAGEIGAGEALRPVQTSPDDPNSAPTEAASRMTAGRTYETNDGARDFAKGDRFLFLENDRTLGVKNGMLGTVARADENEIVVRLDPRDGAEAREVAVPTETYQSFDHGYATTIHKSQGSTVDRTYVLASPMMDRHLTYVAMTRHRDDARLYAGRNDFKNERSLIATLARENLKETTLDYGVADGMRPQAGKPSDERLAETSSFWERCVATYANLRGIEREIVVVQTVVRSTRDLVAEQELERALTGLSISSPKLGRGNGEPVPSRGPRIPLAVDVSALNDELRGLKVKPTTAPLSLGSDERPRSVLHTAGREPSADGQRAEVRLALIRYVQAWERLQASGAASLATEPHEPALRSADEKLTALVGGERATDLHNAIVREPKLAKAINDVRNLPVEQRNDRMTSLLDRLHVGSDEVKKLRIEHAKELARERERQSKIERQARERERERSQSRDFGMER